MTETPGLVSVVTPMPGRNLAGVHESIALDRVLYASEQIKVP
jgi:hypothetical protein